MSKIVQHTRRPDIRIHATGRIDIYARVARLLHLRDGDVINVDERPPERYLYVETPAEEARGRHQGCCRRNNGSQSFRAHSRQITAHLLSETPGARRAAFWCGDPVDPVGGDGMYIPIITRINVDTL